ncbi:hypothetical protein MRY82_04525 [bacterium]|nr:hypothetical protein [bacterium]
MINLIHYLPVIFVVCLFVKPPYFSWLWLGNCLLLVATVIAEHASGLQNLILLNYTAVAPHHYFQLTLLIALSFSALISFKQVNKLAALAAYFIAYYAFELLSTSTWTEFILHFELVAVFSALLIFSRNTYTAQKAAFSYLLLQVFAASCLIAGSLIVHDNTLLHFKWGYDLPTYLILLGFLIHAAVFPFHYWFIHTQEKSCINSKLLSHITLPLLSIFAMTQLLSGHPYLIYVGILSSLYAAIYLLMQNTLPAIVSYFSLVLLGLVVSAVGVGTAYSTQSAFFLIITTCFSFLGYSALIKNQDSEDQKSSDLFELDNKQQTLSPLNSVFWLVFSVSALGIPYLGYGSTAITWFYKALDAQESLTWLNYALAFIYITLLYSLVLKPMRFFNFKRILKQGSLHRALEYILAVLLLSLTVYTHINAPQDYLTIFSEYAAKHFALLFGALPLFFIFKKMLTQYSQQSPTDIFTKLRLPIISKDPTKVRRFLYSPKISAPRVKLFYFESIENSMSYVLVVFIVCMVLFLWL